jgi:hypothetical protein
MLSRITLSTLSVFVSIVSAIANQIAAAWQFKLRRLNQFLNQAKSERTIGWSGSNRVSPIPKRHRGKMGTVSDHRHRRCRTAPASPVCRKPAVAASLTGR